MDAKSVVAQTWFGQPPPSTVVWTFDTKVKNLHFFDGQTA